MAEGLTLDSGASIAAEKGDRRFSLYWEETLDRRVVRDRAGRRGRPSLARQ
jgi:hypothetical protein